jgi:hypothetical protein
LRLPEEIGDPLCDVVAKLEPILDSVHYEGVPYDYQTEETGDPADAPDLHEMTVAEIREEYPDADEREVRLRVAIRESIGMTRDEEDATYERISKALS